MQNTPSSPSISDVKKYWEQNPVMSVEFPDLTDLKSYLEKVDNLRWNDNERWAKFSFYNFDLDKGSLILDAGCGIGFFTRLFARKGFRVHAIDLTKKGVEITSKSLAIFGLKAFVQVASIEEIPYPKDYFDYIVSNGVIHHTPNTGKAVEELYRVLKPGGIASICVYYKNAFLRPPLWNFFRLLIPIILKSKRGREDALSAKSPESLVRTYDGNNTPISKLYSRKQADELLGKFQHIRVEPHYFPVRFLRFIKTGGILHKLLDKYFGVLIYYLVQKSKDSK